MGSERGGNVAGTFHDSRMEFETARSWAQISVWAEATLALNQPEVLLVAVAVLVDQEREL